MVRNFCNINLLYPLLPFEWFWILMMQLQHVENTRSPHFGPVPRQRIPSTGKNQIARKDTFARINTEFIILEHVQI